MEDDPETSEGLPEQPSSVANHTETDVHGWSGGSDGVTQVGSGRDREKKALSETGKGQVKTGIGDLTQISEDRETQEKKALSDTGKGQGKTARATAKAIAEALK